MCDDIVLPIVINSFVIVVAKLASSFNAEILLDVADASPLSSFLPLASAKRFGKK